MIMNAVGMEINNELIYRHFCWSPAPVWAGLPEDWARIGSVGNASADGALHARGLPSTWQNGGYAAMPMLEAVQSSWFTWHHLDYIKWLKWLKYIAGGTQKCWPTFSTANDPMLAHVDLDIYRMFWLPSGMSRESLGLQTQGRSLDRAETCRPDSEIEHTHVHTPAMMIKTYCSAEIHKHRKIS